CVPPAPSHFANAAGVARMQRHARSGGDVRTSRARAEGPPIAGCAPEPVPILTSPAGSRRAVDAHPPDPTSRRCRDTLRRSATTMATLLKNLLGNGSRDAELTDEMRSI